MVGLNDAVISGWVSDFLWPFFRILGFFSIVPLFGAQLVPVPVRVLLALLTTAVLYPVLPEMPALDALSLANSLITGQQMLIGFTLGFLVLTLFQVFIMAGQAMAMQMGLGYASMMDPANGISVTILSQWYLTLVTIMFVTLNGHLVVLEILTDSFFTLPVGGGFISSQGLYDMAGWGSWMFASSLSMALPAIAALLLVNMSFGIMARTAPSMNIFALGFPVTMLVGLFVLWISFTTILPVVRTHMYTVTDMMKQIVGM